MQSFSDYPHFNIHTHFTIFKMITGWARPEVIQVLGSVSGQLLEFSNRHRFSGRDGVGWVVAVGVGMVTPAPRASYVMAL